MALFPTFKRELTSGPPSIRRMRSVAKTRVGDAASRQHQERIARVCDLPVDVIHLLVA